MWGLFSVVSGSRSLVALRGSLIVGASLVERRFWGSVVAVSGLWRTGSVVVVLVVH